MYLGEKNQVGNDPNFYLQVEHFFYAGPYQIAAVGGGEILLLDNSSFVGFHSEAQIDEKSIEAATIGIFARDVFGKEIDCFDGVGVFKNREAFVAKKHILPLSAPMGHKGCEARIRSRWKQLSGKS